MVTLVDPMITFPELMADYCFDDLLTAEIEEQTKNKKNQASYSIEHKNKVR